jgi:hydrogenase maturation protease
MKVLILGVGNLLKGDDGVGLHIVDLLRNEELGDTVDIKDGVSGFDILGEIAGYDKVIIIDAIKTNGQPGTIYTFSLNELRAQKAEHSFSSHNLNLSSLIQLGEKIYPGKIPDDIIIIAIEAKDISTLSETCTPEVEKAIPQVIAMIKGSL